MRVSLTGSDLLHDPMLNKDMAFSRDERRKLKLEGLLPSHQFTIEEQVGSSLTGLSLQVNARDQKDDEGAERGLDIDDDGSGRLDAVDTHHRYVLDEEAPTTSLSTQLKELE